MVRGVNIFIDGKIFINEQIQKKTKKRNLELGQMKKKKINRGKPSEFQQSQGNPVG
jgi:hypothetical protein